MVRAILRRADSFRGRFGARLNLQHLLIFAVTVVSVSGFFHLYVHGFFTTRGLTGDERWPTSIAGVASLSRDLHTLQTKVGKTMEDIQTRMAEEPAETLEEALYQLRSERRRISNLLVEVAVSLDSIQPFLLQSVGSVKDNINSDVSHVSSECSRAREHHRGKTKAGAESDKEKSREIVMDEEKEEGEWEEEVGKEVDPLMDFFEIEEIRKYIKSKPSRLGKKNIMGANATYSSIGHACVSRKFELEQYMDYEVGDYCADDWMLGQKLMIRGCDPLPRRRCFVRAPKTYQKPLPINESLWKVPDDRNVRWDSYICKGFKCLAGANRKGFFKCNECFNLEGHEKPKWMQLTNLSTDADFLMEEVLRFKPGEIRIGLDFSVGVGTFAARMREHNITIASATLNLGAPFNELIALRGLLPLYLSVNQRLPFFDNTLDIVHSTLFLDGWIDHQLLDFILFDWDRVLRPGGLLWIDRFFCKKEDIDDYLYYFEQLRYKRLKWVVAAKVDKDDSETWFSAVLEKPPRPF